MSTTWSIRPARVPPRAAFGQLLRTEWLMMLRQCTGLIAGLALPAVLLVIFGTVPVFRQPEQSLGGLTPLDVYLPIFLTMVLMNYALFNMPPVLASYREAGILRRLSTTPLPPSWVLGVQLILNFCLAVVSVAIMLVVGITAFGLHSPRNPGGFLLACLLAIPALFPLGLLIAALARSGRAAIQIGGILLYPLLFFAGMWYPQQEMPPSLRLISHLTPVGASVQALTSANQGQFPSVEPLLVMVGWAIVLGFLAVRIFKWE